MREYGQIQCAYWQRASEEGWSTDARLLGAYLLSGPHSNGIGCYRLPDGYVCDDLGWDHERVSKGFAELFGNGFCNRFGTVVLIPKFLRWNAIANGNVAKARQQEFEAIPNDGAKHAAAVALLEFGAHWTGDFRNRLETLSKRFAKGYANQNPTQPNPEPTQKIQSGSAVPPPDLLAHVEQSAAPRPPAEKSPKQESKSAATFVAYADAYREVYGADPVRNRQTNAQLCAFIDRVGADEAPHIARFFLWHPNAYYRSRGHSVGCLLNDAEKLRTEWVTQRVTTNTQARQHERTASNAAARIAAEMRAQEAPHA